MNELTAILLTGFLSGGLLKASVDLVKYLRERRKNNADAKEAGVVAPARAESITVETMAMAVQSLSQENARINARLKEADQERSQDRADRAALHREISGLHKALQAAQGWIEALITWGDELVEWARKVEPRGPQPKRPEPPANYRQN